ncbi:MAG TPA: cupin domain-containing protein [Vicinamibacterales bacterium]|nr:cupin domain-containing protein [Vicinamibacterales bacterium]
MTNESDEILFDDMIAVALAHAADQVSPRPEVKQRLLARLAEPAVPEGYTFRFGHDDVWLPHPVPGIRMKVLALNAASGYATLLLDVAPGTTFPSHHHDGAEECYVISGTLRTCGREMRAGDFLHADAGTDHGELTTDTGCRVLLVVPPEDYMSAAR